MLMRADIEAMRERKRRIMRAKRLRAAGLLLTVLASAVVTAGFIRLADARAVHEADMPAAQTASVPAASNSPAPVAAASPRPAEPAPANTDGDILTLVNKWNPITADYTPELVELKNAQAVDVRCYPFLQRMMDDCRQAGCEPLICSSYRSLDYQMNLFENKVAALRAEGFSEAEARDRAAESVAEPGTSEHHLGLAVDIVDFSYQMLDEGQEHTAVQQWLMENCWSYGFILRYPDGDSAVTGIIYEPWHYRFVGVEVAEAMRDSGECLETYLANNG